MKQQKKVNGAWNVDIIDDVLERAYLLGKNYQVEVIAFSWPANGRDGKRKKMEQ